MARLLAQHAPRMAPPERELAQSLAQRLLDWPIDSRQIDLAQFIADCDAVLRLPSSAPEELQLAAAPAPQARDAEVPAQPPEISQPQPVQPPALIAPPIRKDAAAGSPQPDANREAPEEPKRLVPPKAKSMRISDD
jgi:hypothetical protein